MGILDRMRGRRGQDDLPKRPDDEVDVHVVGEEGTTEPRGGWTALLIFYESGPDLPEEWVHSLMQRHGAGMCEAVMMNPGFDAPEDQAGAAEEYELARNAGRVEDLGNVKRFEGGRTPDGRRFASLSFR